MSEKVLLKLSDVTKHELATSDYQMLFWYQKQLYRSIPMSAGLDFSRIMQSNCPEIQSMTPTNFELEHPEGPASVFLHKNYLHRVRPNEVPPNIAKEFVLAICRMNAKLTANYLVITDIHEDNISYTIDGVKWLDIGAIQENNAANAIRAFVATGYLIGKHVLKKINPSVSHQHIDITGIKPLSPTLKGACELDYTKPESWAELERIVIATAPRESMSSHWADEYTPSIELDQPETRDLKGINVAHLLGELDYKTVTDVACNKGFYSFLAARHAKSVIAFDQDEKCIKKAYEHNSNLKLPVVFAVKSIDDMISNQIYESKRFKSDLVLALAIVHHIKMEPAVFVNMLDSICQKYILIENIDSDHIYQSLFKGARYELVKTMPSSPAPRTLSLYRKK
jgi:hypothetical protein